MLSKRAAVNQVSGIIDTRVNEPASGELTQLVHQIASRVGRYLERQGWLERDAENDYLALDGADDEPLDVLQGHSITYRIALGPQAGRHRRTTCLAEIHKRII
jgi:hypothetical protein